MITRKVVSKRSIQKTLLHSWVLQVVRKIISMAIPKNKYPIVFFDGVCNLCNSSVQFIIRYDEKGLIRFAPLQSDLGSQVLSDLSTLKKGKESIFFLENGQLYDRSTAALRVARYLRFPVSLLFLLIVFPAFIRNAVYDYIARNRYKWFGKKDSCMIPTPELKNRFLA